MRWNARALGVALLQVLLCLWLLLQQRNSLHQYCSEIVTPLTLINDHQTTAFSHQYCRLKKHKLEVEISRETSAGAALAKISNRMRKTIWKCHREIAFKRCWRWRKCAGFVFLKNYTRYSRLIWKYWINVIYFCTCCLKHFTKELYTNCNTFLDGFRE